MNQPMNGENWKHAEIISSFDQKPLEEVQTLDEMESRMIEKTIKECEGNLSVVAARLGISRQTLYNKIKRYGI